MARAKKARAGTTITLAGWWHRLPTEQRQGGLAVLSAFVAFTMFLGLWPFAAGTWVAAFSLPARALFGWGTALALLGAITIASIFLTEAIQRRPLLAPRVAIGLAVAFVLLLIESRLILGSAIGGLIGAGGSAILAPLPMSARHILVLGGIALAFVIARRLGWRDVVRGVWALRVGTARPIPIIPLPTTPPPMRASPPPGPHPIPVVAEAPVVPPAPRDRSEVNTLIEALRVPAYLRQSKTPGAGIAATKNGQRPADVQVALPNVELRGVRPAHRNAPTNAVPYRRVEGQATMPLVRDFALPPLPAREP